MWARRMEGAYRIMGVIAYWIGIPAMSVGVMLRIRSVGIASSMIRSSLIQQDEQNAIYLIYYTIQYEKCTVSIQLGSSGSNKLIFDTRHDLKEIYPSASLPNG